jgi:dihydroorotate dehydrogenase electron transfer subunit
MFLTEKLAAAGNEVCLFYGAATATALLPVERFLPAGPRLYYATEDGSAGEMGLLTVAFERALDKGLAPGEIFACGPRPLLALLAEKNRHWGYPLQVSMEENMACGVGACQGCAVLVQKDGEKTYARVCREGPVFCGDEVIW